MAHPHPIANNGATLDGDVLLRALLQACPLAIFILDQHGIVQLWTTGAERLLGWKAEEVLGFHLAAILPDQAKVTADMLVSGLHNLSGTGIDVEWLQKDGRHLHAQLLRTPLPGANGERDSVLVIVVDRTDATQARLEYSKLVEREREVRVELRAERRFRELLEAAPDAIFEVDREGRIVLLNAVAEKMFNYTRDELFHQSVEMLIPDTLRARHQSHREKYWAHPVTRPMGSGLDLRARRKDGSTFPVEISLSPVKYEGGVRVTAIVRDITERRRTEEELRQVQETHTRELAAANAELETRNQEIERANHLKSEFLASMSHELRTPLHTIIGFSELLIEELKGALNIDQKRFVNHIHRDSLHLLELINDILDLSKIEAGRLDLRPELFELAPALDEVLATIRPQGATKSIAIETHVSESMTLEADRVRFKEILYNLLSNALKFTPDGGEVRIEAGVRDEFAEISVADTGIGIPLEQQRAIFEVFRQVATTTKGVREGTGLGLAITKRLVEQHGGTICVESVPKHGSRFTFTMPLCGKRNK